MHSDVLELVTQAWQKLGIDARIDPIDNNYFQARNANWEHAMQISDTNGGGLDPIWRATDYVPIEDDSRFGAGWAMWFLTNGKQGVEPTKDIAERLALYEKVRQTPPGPEQEALMKQVLQRAADAFEIMGISTPPTGQGIVNVDMRNVPDEMPNGFIYLTPQPTLPATYFRPLRDRPVRKAPAGAGALVLAKGEAHDGAPLPIDLDDGHAVGDAVARDVRDPEGRHGARRDRCHERLRPRMGMQLPGPPGPLGRLAGNRNLTIGGQASVAADAGRLLGGTGRRW